MGPTHGPYMLQLCMGPSDLLGVWPLISHAVYNVQGCAVILDV